ncbi:hypothetical protein ACET3Z_025067 [Daucus carota]
MWKRDRKKKRCIVVGDCDASRYLILIFVNCNPPCCSLYKFKFKANYLWNSSFSSWDFQLLITSLVY